MDGTEKGKTMAEYKFTIDGVYYGKNRTFPDLNDFLHECGKNPRAGSRMKRDYQMIAVNAIRKALRRAKAQSPVSIRYVFYEADKKRDKGNILGFADKVIEDALQDVGFIPNDNWKYIAKIDSPEFYIDKDHPRIEVTITEVGEDI